MLRCPFCGVEVQAGEAFELHGCEPKVTALEYVEPGGRRVKYSARYGWRLHRGDRVLGSLTLEEVVELIAQGFTPKGDGNE